MALGGIAAGVGGVLGAIAGGQGSSQVSKKELGTASELETEASKSLQSQLGDIGGLVGAGAGVGDVQQALGSQRDLASLLQQMQQTGGLPSAEQQATAQQFGQDIFAPEQVALEQRFEDEQVKANRLAAQLGRPVNDPIIQAKLAQERTRQQGQLGAQQRAFTAEQARALPLQQLSFAESLANVRGGIAQQAFQNRASLAQLGQGILTQQQGFRLGSATNVTTGGGGTAGAIGGALAGAGGLLGAAGKAQSLFGGGGGDSGGGGNSGGRLSSGMVR